MKIIIIAAASSDGVIAKNGQIPWHIPKDLKHFRNLTMGKPVIIGRKTYETLPKPLDGRLVVVLTKQPNYEAKGCLVAHSVDEAMSQIKQAMPDEEKVFIAGGAEIYKLFINSADVVCLTLVHLKVGHEGVTLFPMWHEGRYEKYCTVTNVPADDELPLYSFLTFNVKGDAT